MEKRYTFNYLLFLMIAILGLIAGQEVKGQTEEDFRSPRYQEAIRDVAAFMGDGITEEDVIDNLVQGSFSNESSKIMPNSINASTMTVTPLLDIVSHDGNSADFSIIIPTSNPVVNATDFTITFIPTSPDWFDENSLPTKDSDTEFSLEIDVDENITPYARAVGIEIKVTINKGKDDEEELIENVAILQLPDTDLEYIIISPETNIIPFDSLLAGFVYLASDVPESVAFEGDKEAWINAVSLNDTKDSILITLNDTNYTEQPREADLQIKATFGDGSTALDMVKVIQLPDTNYLLITPETNIIPFDSLLAGFVYLASDVPESVTFEGDKEAWINAVSLNDTKDSILITLNDTNYTEQPREANLQIKATFGDGSTALDMVKVIQLPDTNYLLITPETNIIPFDKPKADFTYLASDVPESVAFEGDKEAWINAVSLNDTKDSILITLNDTNYTEQPREADLQIKATFGDGSTALDMVKVIQLPDTNYLLITPETNIIPFDSLLAGFVYLASDVPESVTFEGDKEAWINAVSLNDTKDSILITLNDTNYTEQPREANLQIKATFGDGSSALDMVKVIQLPDTNYIVITPEINSVAYNTTSANFDYWSSGPLSALAFQGDKPGWIGGISFDDSDSSITIAIIESNYSDKNRVATLIVEATIDGSKYADVIKIIQDASPQPAILVAPKEHFVAHTGNTVVFDVTAVNIPAGWHVKQLSGEIWTIDTITSDTSFNVIVTENDNLVTLMATYRIYGTGGDDSIIDDTVYIYQYSSLDPYIIAAPREQTAGYKGADIEFDITAVNLNSQGWQLDQSTKPDWIEQLTNNNDTTLSLRIKYNMDTVSRGDTLRIWGQDEDNDTIKDFVSVYQHARPQSDILTAPREHFIAHTGNIVQFEVSAVNIPDGWMIEQESNKTWLSFTIVDSTLFKVTVLENDSLETRIAWYRVHGTGIDTTEVNDTVFIYQYSALDSFLLAAPREREIIHSGEDEVEFQITYVNISGWDLDTTTLPLDDEGNEWITRNENTVDSLLSLKVEANPTLEARQATLRLFGTDPGSIIEDFISIYQNAAPDPYLLAWPREKTIQHSGSGNVEFGITKVNVEDWDVVDSTLADWIHVFDHELDAPMVLNVVSNPELESRADTFLIYATDNTEVVDTVKIYQYSSLDSYLLIEPREQKVGHPEAEISFPVTSVNVGNWSVYDSPNWITDLSDNNQELKLNIHPNTTDSTRIGVIYISAMGLFNSVIDSAIVYQYSRDISYLLASPRQDTIGHNGGLKLFDVLNVNIDTLGWTVSFTPPSTDWISQNTSSQNLLSLSIGSNDSDSARQALVHITAVSDGNVRDSISIYQYSPSSSYILTAPRNQVIPSDTTGSLPEKFTITPVNITQLMYEISYTPAEDINWLDTPAIIDNTLSFTVLKTNTSQEIRIATIRIFDEANPITEDYVHVYQRSSFEPYIILIPALDDSIPNSEYSVPVYTYSNLEEYVARPDTNDWYYLTDSTLEFDDFTRIIISENTNAFSGRSSRILFTNDTVSTNFYLHQLIGPFDEVTISGTVTDGVTGNSLKGIKINAGTSSDITKEDGSYQIDVVKGWRGAIKPESNIYYFNPPQENIENQEGIDEDTPGLDFVAYNIKPHVMLAFETTAICEGDTLSDNGTLPYPTPIITGTYGKEYYKWRTNPVGAESTISNDTIENPKFTPTEPTTYVFELTNNNTTVSDSYTLVVKSRPDARSFIGDTSVCMNQAGVVYYVDDFESSEYFRWELPDGGDIVSYVTTNILVVDWGSKSDTYPLGLITMQDGCSAPDTIIQNIHIGDSSAPDPPEVGQKADDFLWCDNKDADIYRWGWLTVKGSEVIGDTIFISGTDQRYFRIPTHKNDSDYSYLYFVEIGYDSLECYSRSYYNALVGIDVVESDPFKVYPNPTDGIINIRLNQPTQNSHVPIKVYDFSGSLVFNKERPVNTGGLIRINDSRYWNPGIYLIHISLDDNTYYKKVIVR